MVRLMIAVAGVAAALAGTAGMGLVREQAAGLDGGPAIEVSPCQGLCATTFTYHGTEWVATCSELPDDAVFGRPLTAGDGGFVTEVRTIDGVDAGRSLAITGSACPSAEWSLAVPLDEWRPG